MKHGHIFSQIGRRVLPLLLLAGLSAGVLLAADRLFTPPADTPGATPPSVTDNVPDTPAVPNTPGTSAADGRAETTDPVPPADVTHARKAASKEDILRLSANMGFSENTVITVPALVADGFLRSDESYSARTSLIALAGKFDFFPKEYAKTKETVYDLSFVRPSEMSEPEPVYTPREVLRPAIQPYMGFLLMDDGMETRLYTGDGLFLFAYPSGEYTRAFARDNTGAALFYKDETVERPVKKALTESAPDEPAPAEPAAVEMETVLERVYYAVTDTGFAKADYDDTVDGRGVYFDYPAYYGISDNDRRRLVKKITTVEEKLDGTEEITDSVWWAFGNANGWQLTNYSFTGAFDYSEGLAAVLNEKGQHLFLSEWGYYAFNPLKNYNYYDRFVTEYYLPPRTRGEESIGFYYYDHGLVRVRRQVVDWYSLYYMEPEDLRVTIDEDILIDKTGKEFPVPEGYDIVSYSDGMILFLKDGKYGFMDHTGTWIAQPIYDFARPYFEGLAVVGFSDGSRLMLDTEGDIVIPAGVYDHISDASSGVITAYSAKTGWVLYHKMAKFVG